MARSSSPASIQTTISNSKTIPLLVKAASGFGYRHRAAIWVPVGIIGDEPSGKVDCAGPRRIIEAIQFGPGGQRGEDRVQCGVHC